MKKWSIKNILKEILSTFLIVLMASLVINYFRQPDTSDQLPELTLKTIDQQIISTQPTNQPTVLHFWATWCPTCKLEAPNLESIQNQANVITVVVNSGDNETLKAFMKERGYSYRVVNDPNGALAGAFNVEAFPTTFIYNSKGQLKFAEVGYSTTVGLKARLAFIE